MNVKYFIVNGKGKYLSIYVRFWDSKRIDQKTSTGFSTLNSDWSSTKQRLKLKATTSNIDFINSELSNLENFIIDNYNKDYNGKKHISKTWLKENVAIYFGRVKEDEEYKAYLVPWAERFVDNASTRLYRGQQIKPRSIKNYKSALNKLKAFEENQNYKYRFEDIDLQFHKKFITYCRDVENLNNNSIGSLISRIKTFCREIEYEGYVVNPQYKSPNFNAPKNETHEIYLNESEIDRIFNHNFSSSPRLDNARDLFIIGLRTGLRISDFLRITKENIIGNVINITTIKTNQNLTIPIHPQFEVVLAKRDGDLPSKISDQKFNLYIKEVCKKVEINELTFGSKIKEGANRKEEGIFPKHELIKSHVCRRSLATNLYLAGFDSSIIMQATGHLSIKQFISYVKASQDEHIKMISDHWKTESAKLK